MTIENFIEKYLPIRIQSQLSDILKTVFTQPEVQTQITQYERQKYSQYNKVILADTGIPDLMKIINDLTVRMTSAIQVRGKKTQGITDQKLAAKK